MHVCMYVQGPSSCDRIISDDMGTVKTGWDGAFLRGRIQIFEVPSHMDLQESRTETIIAGRRGWAVSLVRKGPIQHLLWSANKQDEVVVRCWSCMAAGGLDDTLIVGRRLSVGAGKEKN